MNACAVRLISVAILVGVALPAWTQAVDESATRTKILALEHIWDQASAFNDFKALDAIFDNALLYVDAHGTLMTKPEFLLHAKSAHLQQVISRSMSVQVFDKVVIVVGTYEAKSLKGAKTTVERGRFIDTWVYKKSTWVCVAAQDTPINDTPINDTSVN